MIYRKKHPLALCFVFFFSGLLSAQNAPKDLVVLVDTSASMSSFYTNLTNYLTGPFLEENLNLGDTFHLISFSGKPRFEIARRVIDLGDVQTINGRIFLLYPLEPVSDISSAISYGERYITILPQSREKRI
ncbi:MAG: VWA domain-containing protein, partial [Treponema sp.]|nr:VWA domain-containing protein [Treponema sp.]